MSKDFYLSNKLDNDIKNYLWLRKMDLCRLQVSIFVPQPVFMYHVALCLWSTINHYCLRSFRVKLLKYFPSRPSKAMLSRKLSVVEILWLCIRILFQSLVSLVVGFVLVGFSIHIRPR